MEKDIYFLQETITLSEQAYKKGQVPVGAILVDDKNNIISKGFNNQTDNEKLSHAEIITLKNQPHLYLPHCTLYVSLEPCIMCYGASLLYKIPKIIYLLPCSATGIISLGINTDNYSLCMKSNENDISNTYKELLKKYFIEKRKKNNKE